MHLKNVEIFCDVALLRSFSRAAEAHSVSQPSVSQAVGQLEKHLETVLIDRSKRPLELTPAGEMFYAGCRAILDEFRHLEDSVREVGGKISGKLRVAAIYSVGLLQMEGILKQFQQQFPDVEVYWNYLHPEEVYDRVLHDEADLGLISFPREGGPLSSIPWQEQKMVLVVSPGHRLAEQESVSVTDLSGEDYVAFTQDLQIRKIMDKWFRQARLTVRIVHEFDNVENIKRAVEIGSGVSFLPAPTVRREVVFGSLKAITLRDVDWKRPLGIVHRRHKTLSNAAQKFVELLLQDQDEEEESATLDKVVATG